MAGAPQQLHRRATKGNKMVPGQTGHAGIVAKVWF